MAAARIRLGARLPLPLGPAADLRALGAAADAAGFDALFVPDRPERVLATEGALEAYTALGALALSTTVVRLGALASALPGRPPSLVAKQVTTLDRLSGGRALLGLGITGGDWKGRAELRQALAVCRAMFCSEEAVSAGGRRHGVEGAVNRPGPVQAGGPPVVVMVRPGDGLLLPVAARHADVVVLAGSLSAVRRRRRLIGAVGRRPGRQGTPHVLALVPLGAPGGDGSAVTAAVQRALECGVDGVVLDLPPGTGPDALLSTGEAAAGR